jgi:predicted component of type VI protein secretion system
VHLTYRYETLVRRRDGDSLTIGRDPDCDLCIDMRLASRRHCTVERRGDKLFLRDHSTNGTFVTLDGGREARIRTEEIVLHGRGWLSFGVSRLLAEELVQFRCE